MKEALRVLLAKLDLRKRQLESLPPIRITERAGLRVEIAELEKQIQSKNNTPTGTEA